MKVWVTVTASCEACNKLAVEARSAPPTPDGGLRIVGMPITCVHERVVEVVVDGPPVVIDQVVDP